MSSGSAFRCKASTLLPKSQPTVSLSQKNKERRFATIRDYATNILGTRTKRITRERVYRILVIYQCPIAFRNSMSESDAGSYRLFCGKIQKYDHKKSYEIRDAITK